LKKRPKERGLLQHANASWVRRTFPHWKRPGALRFCYEE
jgi:hypothetical protein